MSLGIFQLSLVNVCSVYIFHCCRCMELGTFKKKMRLHTISSIQFLIARYIHYVDINITSVMENWEDTLDVLYVRAIWFMMLIHTFTLVRSFDRWQQITALQVHCDQHWYDFFCIPGDVSVPQKYVKVRFRFVKGLFV